MGPKSTPAGLAVTDLTCEYLTNPLGIDTPRPRLAWKLRSDRRGARQTAYRIQVAGSIDRLTAGQADIWDTGSVESDRSTHVQYAGPGLASRQRVAWRVQVWDESGHASDWSEPATFEMGLLNPTDWQGRWIGMGGADAPICRPAPHLRKAFGLGSPVKAARAYICGLGYYVLRINGRRVGDHVLDPGFTRYDKRVLYATYDVTDLLDKDNVVAVTLGNGFYNQDVPDAWHFHETPWRDNPRLICEIHVEFEDGTTAFIGTNGDWKVSTGPVQFDGTRSGEEYDARKQIHGWDSPGFDDSAWAAAAEVPAPAGVLRAQTSVPIKVTQTITPVAITEPDPGVYIVDLGQNMAGWVQLRVTGPTGTEITLRHTELLDKAGRLDNRNINCYTQGQRAFQTVKYTLCGDGEETFEPSFCYHGFRYVEVTGWPGAPTLDNFRGRVVHTAFPPAGKFECSNDLLNRIQANTLWSYRGNFHSIPTDCPHREKNGWTGDAHIAAETGLYNFHAETAYTKWMNDFADEQRDTGELPGIVPTSGWGYQWGNGPCWDSAYVLIPWYLYLYKGDSAVFEAHFENFKRYVDYLTGRSDKYIVYIGLADWCPPFGRSADYTAPATLNATAYYYNDAVVVSMMASVLGKTDDADKYAKLAQKIKKAFNVQFYDKISGLYAGGSQTAQATALYQDLAPANQRKKVARQLAAEVRQQKYRLNAGIHGAKFVLNALSETGRHDIAWRLATERRFPSWGWWIDQGATTLWENWNGASSRNHIMYGDISAWMFKHLAGIQVDPAKPGFKNVIINPQPVGDLEWVSAEHESMYGTIRSAWRKENDRFALDVTIPPNTTASVLLPTGSIEDVTESGQPLNQAQGVELTNGEDGQVALAVQSGTYRFEWPAA